VRGGQAKKILNKVRRQAYIITEEEPGFLKLMRNDKVVKIQGETQ